MKTPTTNQRKAASSVLKYLAEKRLSIEEKTDDKDGNIVIELSDRDESDIADESPNREILETFNKYMTELRELSPLVFVAREIVDEWVNLRITIRATPRKPRPDEIKNLTEKLIKALPSSILKHPRVTGAYVLFDRDRGIDVRTDVPGPIGKRAARLTWVLDGNSVDGWHLIVMWGRHKATRKAAFKKLTPRIIIDMLNAIIAELKDPMDCFGYTINIKDADGRFIMTPSRHHRQTVELWEVESYYDKLTFRSSYRGETSGVCINNLTDEELRYAVGDAIPTYLRNLDIKL